jgi:RNA polymerase sigma factor (sigma-70 family)
MWLVPAAESWPCTPIPVSIDWSEVYRTTYQELVRFLHRKVWDADRAQDLAQEAFVRALDQEPMNPRAWLFRVATNLARDEARMVVRRKKHLTLLRTEAEVAEAAVPEASRDLEQGERMEAVRRALDTLTERDRDVLLLWDAGLNYAEIAAQTGLAAGAIGTTLARARHRLVEAHTALEGKHAARG